MNDATLRLFLRGSAVAATAAIAGVAGWATAWWNVEGKARDEMRRREAFDEQCRRDTTPTPGRATYVSAAELITNPEKYNDHRVIISGVWTVGFEHSQLDLQNSAQDFWIWVEPDWTRVDEPMGDLTKHKELEEGTKPDRNGHVAYRIVAEGTFRFRKKNTAPELNGFGHMSVSEGYFLFDRLFEFEVVAPEEPNQPLQPTRPIGPRG